MKEIKDNYALRVTHSELVLATGNPGKLQEMEVLLSPLSLGELRITHCALRIDETGDTFLENARIKAGAALALTALPSLADDSGLAVDALGGAPGVRSARYGGEGLSASERNALLLKEMEGKENRAARFVCVLCCLFPDGREIIAEGTCEGEILHEPRGTGGFGYDPIFFVPSLGRGMAELSEAEKNKVSHRWKAVSDFLKQWNGM